MRCAATEKNEKNLKVETESCSARSLGCIANDFVSVTLCKISSRRLWLIFKVTKKTHKNQKTNKQ